MARRNTARASSSSFTIIADRLERQPRFIESSLRLRHRPLRATSFWLQIDAYSVPEQNPLAFHAVFCAAEFRGQLE
jgi:hypothetical protein